MKFSVHENFLHFFTSKEAERVVGTLVGLYLKASPRIVLPQVIPLSPVQREYLQRYVDSLDFEKKRKILMRFLYFRKVRKYLRKWYIRKTGGVRGTPPLLTYAMISIRGDCNLSCEGCYSGNRKSKEFAPIENVEFVIYLLHKLFTPYVMVIGEGEPFLDLQYASRLIDCIDRYHLMEFGIFTNGTTINSQIAKKLGRLSNAIVLVSVDGLKETHNSRRGKGCWEKVMKSFELLRQEKVFYGFSATVTKDNWEEISSESFLNVMVSAGCLVGIYVRFFSSCSHPYRLPFDEYEKFKARFNSISMESQIPVVDIISAEERRYGCMAAKGAMIFIDALAGDVFPCPFWPRSERDCNVFLIPEGKGMEVILNNEFFREYRRKGEFSGNCFK